MHISCEEYLERERRWAEMYKGGMSTKVIAKVSGRSSLMVMKALRKQGVIMRPVGRVPSGVPKRDIQLRNHLKQYRMTLDEYKELLEKQSNLCAICHRPPKGGRTSAASLHVDHDHTTGKTRGLLCRACNVTLGQMGEDPARLRAAADYLERYAIRP